MNENDVLCQRGKGRHQGNVDLRATISDNFNAYDAATLNEKREMVETVVLGVSRNGGRFIVWNEEDQRYYEITNKDAVRYVRTGFDRYRSWLKKQTTQQASQETSDPEENRAGVAPRVTEQRNGNEKLSSGMESTSLHSDPLRFMSPPPFDLFEDEDTVVVDNKVRRYEDDNDSARGMLFTLLFDEGGEQLAETLMSLVNSAGQEALPAPALPPAAANPSYSAMTLDDQVQETLKAAKESLQKKQRPSKRARYNAPAAPKGVEETQTQPDVVRKAGRGEDDIPKSIQSSQSVLSFKTEQDMPKIKIEKNLRMAPKEGAKKDRQYTGSTMKGKPHGTGVMIYDHGRILIGNWLHGVFQGQGCAIYENGDKCFGSFFKNKVHGFTTYMTAFTKYIGQYHKHHRHGRGVFMDMERGSYSGDFVDGRFEGLGIHTDLNQNIIQGHFEDWEYVDKASCSEADHEEASLNT